MVGILGHVKNTIDAGRRWYAGEKTTYSKDNSDGMLVVTWLDQLDSTPLNNNDGITWYDSFEAEFVRRYGHLPEDVRYVIGIADSSNPPSLTVNSGNLNSGSATNPNGGTGTGTGNTSGSGTAGGAVTGGNTTGLS